MRCRQPEPSRAVHEFARKWLGREDSNLRMVESKSTALPLGDAPSRFACPYEQQAILNSAIAQTQASKAAKLPIGRHIWPDLRLRG